MSDKPVEVLIEREGRTWRWGESHYLRRWNGLKQTLSVAGVKMVALPLALTIGIVTFFFSDQKEAADKRGEPVEMPKQTLTVPVIKAPILGTNDLTNSMARPRVGSGMAGPIKVFNLRGLSQIPVGAEAKAILESGGSNGIVKARLVSGLRVDGEPVIPEGATIFGRGQSSEARLYVEFEKAIFPNGETFSIRGQAFDVTDKILGLKGKLVGTRAKKMGLAIGFGVLGGLAEGLQDTSGSNLWGIQKRRSVKDSALSGASKATLDQSQIFADEMKNAPNTIEVKRGTEFYLIIDEPKEN